MEMWHTKPKPINAIFLKQYFHHQNVNDFVDTEIYAKLDDQVQEIRQTNTQKMSLCQHNFLKKYEYGSIEKCLEKNP